MRRLLSVILLASAAALAQTSNYPGAIDTDAQLFVTSDNLQTSLSSPMAAGDTVAVVASSTGWAANMIGTVCDAVNSSGVCTTWEHMLVTAVNGNVLTVTRGFAGTTARAHVQGLNFSALIDHAHQAAASSAIKAIENTLGANLSNVPASPVTNSSPYNFSAYSCNSSAICSPSGSSGMSLIVGNNTLTMNPVPAGVASTHTVANNLPHLLYVSGGTGTAEACPISGGSGTPGNSGQIIINCAYTHSGAWTIKSNSTGIQEALYAAGAQGAVAVPAGNYDLWANTATIAAVEIPDGWNTALFGAGVQSTFFLTHGTTGDWIRADYVSNLGTVDMGDFTIEDASNTQHTSGAMVHIRYRVDGLVRNINAHYAYIGVEMERNARATYLNVGGDDSWGGLWVTCAGVNFPSCQNQGTVIGGHWIADGNSALNLRIEAPTTGLKISEVFTEGGAFTGCTSLGLTAIGTNPLHEIQIFNNILDGCGYGVVYTGNGASNVDNYVVIHDNEINAATFGVDCAGYCTGLSLVGNVIGVAGGGVEDRAILLGFNASNIYIANNPQLNSDGDAAILTQGPVSNVDIENNTFGVWNQSTWCLSFGGSSTTGIHVRGNNFLGNAGSAGCTSVLGGSATNLSMTNNAGVDDVIPTVASAASFAAPVNPTFIVSGTTNITSLTFPLAAGSKFTFLETNAAPPTWTAGTGIGASFTPAQNVPVSCYWDGTKAWCKP